MVGTRSIVPGALRRIVAQKDRTSILYRPGVFLALPHAQDQVFGCIGVGKLQTTLDALQDDDPGMRQGLFGYVPAGQLGQLTLQFGQYPLG